MPTNTSPELPLTEIPTARSSSSQSKAIPGATSNDTYYKSQYSTPQNASAISQNEKPAHIHNPRGRRQKREDSPSNTTPAENDHTLNEIGKIYEKILTYSTGTRYSIYILPVGIIFAIPIILGATIWSHSKIGGIKVDWFFAWIEAVWLAFWAMKFVARLIPKIFALLSGVVSSETKKYARVLYNLQDMIAFFGWVVVSFVLYEVLFSTAAAGNTPSGWTTVTKKILGAILVSTIIFFIEKIFVQLVSVNYHARSFNNRIAASKHAVYLLALLFDASRTLFPLYGPDFINEDYVIHSSLEAFVKKGGWRMSDDPNTAGNGHHGRVFKGIGKFSNKVNSVFGNIAAELTGKSVLPPRSSQSIIIQCLERTKAAKALGERLWYSFVLEGNDALHLTDLEEVLGPESHRVAQECFDYVDPDGNEDVSLDEFTMKITELALDRKAIVRSMHDVSQAIKALDNVMSFVALLLSLFALVSFLDTGFHSILSTASTTLLSLSFIFSVTAQEFLGSCIFLFVKHPYDISDRVDIYGPDGVNKLEVEQISLLYTSFKRITDMELIQIPNNILNTLWINNLTRSRSHLSVITLSISFDTSLTSLSSLQSHLETFVRDPRNKRDFYPDIVLQCVGVGTMDALQLRLEVRHKSNWWVESIRASRHSKLMCALVVALRDVGIFGPGGGEPVLGERANPAYSVAVDDGFVQNIRNKEVEKKENAELQPLDMQRGIEENTFASNFTSPNIKRDAAAASLLYSTNNTSGLLRDEELDEENMQITPTYSSSSSSYLQTQNQRQRGTTLATVIEDNNSNLKLKKSTTPQGRRKAGLSVASRKSTISQSEEMRAQVAMEAAARPERVSSRVLEEGVGSDTQVNLDNNVPQ